MKVATVLERSLPFFMIRRHSTISSVLMREVIVSVSSPLTRAPITPRLVTLIFSKGRCLTTLLMSGYRYRWRLAPMNRGFVT